MTGAGRRMGLYQGRIFWSGSVSLVDGRIEETHTVQEAQAADFHHTFYFSPEQASKIDDGECGFFWISEDGEVEAEWREALGREIICGIKEQITVIDVTGTIENEGNKQEREREDMTGFEKFQQKIKDGILAYMPEEYQGATVDIVHVQKNNDQDRVGMTIRTEGQTVAATVYLERYYSEFPEWVSEQIIFTTIAEEYLKSQAELSQIKAMADSVKDYDSVKDSIRVQVVNKEANQESLRHCPKKEVEGTDLLAVFRVMFYNQGKECASALITDAVMEKWDTDLDSLYETALKNTVDQAPAQINSMMSVLFGGEESLAPEDVFQDGGLYILTNPQKDHGAVTMLYPGLLQSIAEATRSSFYILPSSIHEVLLIKGDNGMDAKELQSMVMDINQREVAPQDVLSNQVYFYDGKEQKISMALSPEETRELEGDREIATAGYEGMETEGMEEEMER